VSAVGEQFGETFLALDQRPETEIFAIEVQEIEQEENQRRGVAAARRQLDHAERGDAVGTHAGEFAVAIGLAGSDRCDGRGDRRIFVRPVEPGAGEQTAPRRDRGARACDSRRI
jgi:hypothetical protein